MALLSRRVRANRAHSRGRKRETHPGVVTDLGFACAGVWRIQVIVWAWRGQAKEIPWSSRKISAHDGNGVKMLLLRLRITVILFALRDMGLPVARDPEKTMPWPLKHSLSHVHRPVDHIIVHYSIL